MRLLNPQWLLLLPLLLAAGWFWPRLGLFRPLRLVCLAFAILLLAQPQMRFRSDGLDLWVLVDRSDSAKGLMGTKVAEWEQILDKSKGAKDRLHLVDYAAEAGTRGALITAGPNATDYEGPTTATRSATAVSYALSQMEADRAGRLLILTDGYSTEPLDGLAERLIKQEVSLEFRLDGATVAGDERLAA
ncbi:MAG: von Willebrand factor type, partial [Verrucomicrobiaceae bacterium]|nr:von Willebrand factor type [Verrucomicrobiaceae bacterium]